MISFGAAYWKNEKFTSWLARFQCHCECTVVQEDGSQVPPVYVIYGYVMNIQCWELNLVQNLITIILGIANSNHKVSIILVTTSNFLEVVADWKKKHFTLSLFLEKQLYNLDLEISQA